MNGSSKPSLLIVDDDPLIVDALGYFLSRDFEITSAASRAQALAQLRPEAAPFAAALVDLGLPPAPHRPDEGLALVGELLTRAPTTKIVILSGQNEEANARHARALGAADFVAKPADPAHLRRLLLQLLSASAAEQSAAETPQIQLIGDSPPMQKLRLQLRQYANAPFPVLIEGESGSGKEIAARALHELSDRAAEPYFALNCAAIAPTLVEPTLFGHAKGAFTGAAGARSGYFEDAGQGTLFLDEIGELPLELQPKLLRVLENGEFQRVGETQSRTSRARVVAATNRDLRKEVREGRFRADLYHRLSVFTVAVPALREMGDDRLRLLDHFRRIYAQQLNQPPFALSAEAEELWRDYHFPGNVRELRNIVIRLMTKHPGEALAAGDLLAELDSAAPVEPQVLPFPADPDEAVQFALRHLQQARRFSLDETLAHWERAYVDAAQQLAHGNLSQAARLLGIHRTTLYNRIEALRRDRETS